MVGANNYWKERYSIFRLMICLWSPLRQAVKLYLLLGNHVHGEVPYDGFCILDN